MSSRRGTWLVLALILIAVLVSAGTLLMVAITAGAPPSIPSNGTLYLKIHAPWNEVEPLDVLSQFVPQAPTLRETLELIRQAKRDSRVKTLVILPQTEAGLWAQLQEVRDALVDFKTSGKPITAFLEYGGAQEYLLASVADRIIMMPGGQLDLTGLATYELFFRGALDKIGVYPDLLHIGDYKTYSNTFVEKGFTPAHREMSRSLNHDWYEQLVRAIADGRKRPVTEIRAAIDGGPYLADEAKKAGLIDALGYQDQIDDAAPVQGTRKIEGETYAKVPSDSVFASGRPRIAMIYATGTIASGKSAFDGAGGTVLGSDTFGEWLEKARVDTSVRAVVVRIDSPGGSAIASEAMWRSLMLTRDVKPLIVSMGDVAASGGYYIAAPADVIVAEPGTITGSIGVVTGKFVLKGTMDKLGVGTDSVSDGKLAEIYSPFKPFSADERARIADQMQSTYELFVSRVAEGRHTTAAKIDPIAQGRVWTGQQARDLGLVDELGGLDTAVGIAKQRAKIDPKKDVELIVYPPKRSVFEVLAQPFGGSSSSSSSSSTAAASAALLLSRPEARVIDRALSILRLFHRGEPLAVMPNVFWRD